MVPLRSHPDHEKVRRGLGAEPLDCYNNNPDFTPAFIKKDNDKELSTGVDLQIKAYHAGRRGLCPLHYSNYGPPAINLLHSPWIRHSIADFNALSKPPFP